MSYTYSIFVLVLSAWTSVECARALRLMIGAMRDVAIEAIQAIRDVGARGRSA